MKSKLPTGVYCCVLLTYIRKQSGADMECNYTNN